MMTTEVFGRHDWIVLIYIVKFVHTRSRWAHDTLNVFVILQKSESTRWPWLISEHFVIIWLANIPVEMLLWVKITLLFQSIVHHCDSIPGCFSWTEIHRRPSSEFFVERIFALELNGVRWELLPENVAFSVLFSFKEWLSKCWFFNEDFVLLFFIHF